MSGPQVVNVDRMNGDVIVSFEDGVIALYSAELLYEILAQAMVLPPSDLENEDGPEA